MATITRSDLALSLRNKFGFTTAQSGKLVDVIFDEICESLVNGEEVKFAGFGTFKILDKSARVGRNPKTGEIAIVTARRVVTFRPSSEFRDRVAGRERPQREKLRRGRKPRPRIIIEEEEGEEE